MEGKGPVVFPTDWSELRSRPIDPASKPVSAEMQLLDGDHQIRTRNLRSLDKAAASTDEEPLILDGFRPDWSDLSYRPQKAARPTPMRVTHRGEAVNPLHIIWPDNRTVYFDTAYPWGCVCKVVTAKGGEGSGVLIGPRHVLTASHCIDWSTDRAELVEVHRQGTFFSAASFDTNVLAYTQIQGGATHSTIDEDYAVMILADRLGDRFGWMGCRTYDAGWDDEGFWVTTGYPGDLGGLVPTYQRGVYLDEDEFDLGGGRAMTTNADLKEGQSGSPFFAWWDNAPYVVAVVSSEERGGSTNWASGGNDLTRLVNQARRDFP